MGIINTKSILKSVASQLSTKLLGKGSADIIIAGLDNSGRIVFPVVPAELPSLESPQNNDTFRGISGDLAIIGTMGLRKISWEGFLPQFASSYNFCKSYGDDADDIINFIKKYQLECIPMRIVIVYNDGSVYVNMACLCNNFTYTKNNIGDYHYAIDLIEYRIPSEEGALL